jgi:hypothetical protein
MDNWPVERTDAYDRAPVHHRRQLLVRHEQTPWILDGQGKARIAGNSHGHLPSLRPVNDGFGDTDQRPIWKFDFNARICFQVGEPVRPPPEAR